MSLFANRCVPPAVVVAAAVLVIAAGQARGADEGSRFAPPPAASLPAGDVAIGQPITLPAGEPAQAPATTAAAAPLPGAGTGWLGLTVDDSIVTGRLSVVDVAADGPAAKAGIRPQDVLLALDGRPLNNDDELAAALAAIAPGQEVKAAIGRDNRVENLAVTASPRPADSRGRTWQGPAGPSSDNAARVLPPAPPAAAGVVPLAAAAPQAVAAPAFGQPAAGFEQAAPTGTVTQPMQAIAPPVPGGTAPPPLSAVPSRSVLVQATEPAPAVAALADAPPSPFAQAPPVMSPAPRFEAAAAAPRAAPPAAPFGGAITAPSAASMASAEPPAPATRRFAEPAGLLPAPAAAPAASPARPQATGSGRPALGVRTVPVDTSVQSRFRLSDPRGAFVIGVVHDLPASRAGVPPGSVIVAINDRPVSSPQDLSQLVSHGPVGIPVSLQYVLPGGEAKRAEVVLQPLEAPLERALVGAPAAGEAVPATEPPVLQPTPAIARRLPPTATTDAVVIVAGGEVLPASALLPITAAGTPAAGDFTSAAGAATSAAGAVPQAESATLPRPLQRLEEMLRRIDRRLDQLEQLERRLEAIERGGR